MDQGFDWISSVKQIAEYEKRRPKKYRSTGWKYYDSYFRGLILTETLTCLYIEA